MLVTPRYHHRHCDHPPHPASPHSPPPRLWKHLKTLFISSGPEMKSTPVVTLSHLSLYEGKWFHSFAAVQWSRPTLLWPLGSYRGGQRVKQLWAQCVQLLCTTVYLHWTYWISAREKWGWGNHLLTGWCSDLGGRRCELWVQARVSVKERLRLKVCALDNLYLHAHYPS